MKELAVTDEQYRTLVTVLYLVSQADSGQKAVWFDEYDREKVSDLHETVNEQEASA